MTASLWQAQHPLELQSRRGNHSLIYVTASGRVMQPIGNVAPGFPFLTFGRRARLQRTFALTKKSYLL
jgi:hypothetical protein